MSSDAFACRSVQVFSGFIFVCCTCSRICLFSGIPAGDTVSANNESVKIYRVLELWHSFTHVMQSCINYFAFYVQLQPFARASFHFNSFILVFVSTSVQAGTHFLFKIIPILPHSQLLFLDIKLMYTAYTIACFAIVDHCSIGHCLFAMHCEHIHTILNSDLLSPCIYQ